MSADPIITDLIYAMETGTELDILNFFKSFPITCRARVDKVEQDVVSMKVQPPGSICLAGQSETIVLSRGLPEAIRGSIVSFDLASGMLKLKDFSYVGSHFGERMIARVQPDDIISLEISAGSETYPGTLVDVSLSGVGVYVSANLERGQLIQLTMPLPEGKVTLPGKILNISDAPGGQYRLAVGFTRNAQEIAVIMRYIRERRKEILDEVERLYEQAYQEQKK
jgi:hypothetical protein